MCILRKSIKSSWRSLFWGSLVILCLISWLNLAQSENVAAHMFADVNVDLALELVAQPTYCPESNPESSTANGPCNTGNDPDNDTAASVSDSGKNDVYLPIIMHDYPVSNRLGVGFTYHENKLMDYSELELLRAGWYVDWRVNNNPPLPRGMEYVQMIRIHQVLDGCQKHVSSDRKQCPYLEPYAYNSWPSREAIPGFVRQNPGAIWLIGNEMERIDWGTPEEPGGQDEILPTYYPVVYHDIYHIIKKADPTARVAIGGVIQPTPLRLQYLSIVWDTYQELYGKPMPVDVWNVHNFILPEKRNSWGAEIPVGVPVPPTGEGEYVGDGWKHIDMVTFDRQIRAFRLWMKDRGQQNKELIVSEYGALLPNYLIAEKRGDQKPIQKFMTDSFDYFLNTKDRSLGYPADDYRLVQRWNWFSLDHAHVKDNDFNEYARLYDPETQELTETGRIFRDYSQNNMSRLSYR